MRDEDGGEEEEEKVKVVRGGWRSLKRCRITIR